jgi:DnaJ-class molecular chaperone
MHIPNGGRRSSTPARDESHACCGDLPCHVVIETPVKLNDRQKELLRQCEAVTLEDTSRHDPRAKGWMGKVKDFFADREGSV